MNHSTPGPPVPEFIQTHVHQVSDAIQPSHPLSSPSPPAPNPSQHMHSQIDIHTYLNTHMYILHTLHKNTHEYIYILHTRARARTHTHTHTHGLPWWLRRSRVGLQCRRPGFDPWVGKTPWRREWQPTPVFVPGKSHGPRSLVGYSPWGRKESDTTE